MRMKRALVALVFAVVLFAVAQEAAGDVTVQTVTDSHGAHLVDGIGHSLYMSMIDPKGESMCLDECLDVWQPVLATGEVMAGSGVAPTLLGTLERPGGDKQVTYFGIPLYLYSGDIEPGDTNGQGVDGNWYLVSPFGAAIVPSEPVATDPSSDEADMAGAELQAVMELGGSVFSGYCSACHGTRGAGGVGPRLDGARLDDDRRNIRQVLNGGGHMPGFRNVLDDEQVAAVVTYIRKSWSNDFPSVTPEEVMNHR